MKKYWEWKWPRWWVPRQAPQSGSRLEPQLVCQLVQCLESPLGSQWATRLGLRREHKLEKYWEMKWARW